MSGTFLISIGAMHPWNIAGIGIDAGVAYEYGLRQAIALVGVTAQDERGLRGAFALPPNAVRAQLQTLPPNPAAIRIGALFDAANIAEVSRFLQRDRNAPLVIDPVFSDTFGSDFADARTIESFRDIILPLRSVLTPNLPEARRLLERDIPTVEAMVDAARELQSRGPVAVLLKGGHRAGDPVDVLATNESVEIFSDDRLQNDLRGTGDTLAAALACELATGRSLLEGVIAARHYVRRKITLSLEEAKP